MQELTSDATPVSRALVALNVPHRVLRHPGPLNSLEQAAAERGQRPEQVIRSIVFRLSGGEFVMVLTSGSTRISWPALREYLGQSRLTTASEEELLRVTGYARGAVAPFGLPAPMRILVAEYQRVALALGQTPDQSLLAPILETLERIQATPAAGEPAQGNA